MAMNREDSRDLLKANSVLYIYHNRIDHTGDHRVVSCVHTTDVLGANGRDHLGRSDLRLVLVPVARLAGEDRDVRALVVDRVFEAVLTVDATGAVSIEIRDYRDYGLNPLFDSDSFAKDGKY